MSPHFFGSKFTINYKTFNIYLIMFIQFFIIVFIGLIYLVVARPLIPLIKMKIKLGDKAVIQYFPIIGLFGIWTQSLKKEHDILKTQYAMLKRNPNI